MTPPHIERLLHRREEVLRGSDFQAAEITQAAVWAWHNRAVHATYGVADGLEVAPVREGPDGPWRARVDPGVAYDLSGRSLILAEAVELVIPARPTGLSLVVRAGDPTAELVWIPTADFLPSDGVAIAKSRQKIEFKNLPPPDQPEPWPDLDGQIGYVKSDPDLDPQTVTITVRGVLTPAGANVLFGLYTNPGPLRPAVDGWPLDAPVRNAGRVGLVVSVVPNRPTPPDPAKPLWTLHVTQGSALTGGGDTLVLSADFDLDMTQTVENQQLVLFRNPADATKTKVALRKESPKPEGDEVLLATVTPPEDLKVRVTGFGNDQNQAIITTRTDLKNAGKIALPTDDEVVLAGWFTHGERLRLLTALGAVDTPAASAAKKRLAVPPAVKMIEDSTTAPFFPTRSRPLARPRSASGSTVQGRTEWKAETPLGSGMTLYSTAIDYSAAGFTKIPQVFAWLERVPAEGEPVLRPLFRCEIDDDRLTVKGCVVRLWHTPDHLMPKWFTDEKSPWAGPDEAYLRERLFVRWVALESDLGGRNDTTV